MAISNNYQVKSDVIVNIGTEVEMGTACSPADGTWHTIDCTDFTISENTAPLEIAPQRSGILGQGTHQAKHSKDKQTFEIELQFNGSPSAINRMCLALYGDGDGTNALTGALPSVKKYEHGVANTVPITLHFEKAGHDGAKDLIYKSCLCTGLSFNYGLSDGGVLKCSAKFMTAYNPTEATHDSPADTSGSITDTLGTPLNFHDVDVHTIDSGDVLMSDFSVDISRSVSVTAFDVANGLPSGYSIGGYEVTGSITCKRDAQSDAVEMNDSTGKAIAVADTDIGFSLPTAMIESASTSTGDPAWNTTFNFRGMYSGTDETSTIVSIKTA